MSRYATGLALALLVPFMPFHAYAQFERGMVVTGFRVPEYDEKGQLKTQIFGEKAVVVTDSVVDITRLEIETFEDGKVDMRVRAAQCRFDQHTGVATSDQDVRITRRHVIISGTGFRWESEPVRFEIHRDARVVIRMERKEKKQTDTEEPTP